MSDAIGSRGKVARGSFLRWLEQHDIAVGRMSVLDVPLLGRVGVVEFFGIHVGLQRACGNGHRARTFVEFGVRYDVRRRQGARIGGSLSRRDSLLRDSGAGVDQQRGSDIAFCRSAERVTRKMWEDRNALPPWEFSEERR